jgi:hypothetical protein
MYSPTRQAVVSSDSPYNRALLLFLPLIFPVTDKLIILLILCCCFTNVCCWIIHSRQRKYMPITMAIQCQCAYGLDLLNHGFNSQQVQVQALWWANHPLSKGEIDSWFLNQKIPKGEIRDSQKKVYYIY